MRYFYLFIFSSLLLGCTSKAGELNEVKEEIIKRSRFSGNYNKGFNDLHELHMEAAQKHGIKPLSSKDDTINLEKDLKRIPKYLPYFKTDNLTHSIPYLVPQATDLLLDISINFRDSLISKNFPLHKLVLTSITRTQEDVKKLTRSNINASSNSAHCYGTTFDISWKRYEKVNPYDEEISSDKLKLALGEVLHDLRESNRCYIKHEKKQACFHITVR